jgi:hypothetical protein
MRLGRAASGPAIPFCSGLPDAAGIPSRVASMNVSARVLRANLLRARLGDLVVLEMRLLVVCPRCRDTRALRVAVLAAEGSGKNLGRYAASCIAC